MSLMVWLPSNIILFTGKPDHFVLSSRTLLDLYHAVIHAWVIIVIVAIGYYSLQYIMVLKLSCFLGVSARSDFSILISIMMQHSLCTLMIIA